MFGVVLGKHKHISLKELEMVQPDNIAVQGHIATFETNHENLLPMLAGIIKRGKVIPITEVGTHEIIGTNETHYGKERKSAGLTRRFKLVPLDKTDEEVRKKGKEYIVIDDNFVLDVMGYQNIEMYEIIDFEKPVNSMKTGMMPAKLTHIMLNIGLGNAKIDPISADITIYDPFVGLGTTALLANALKYNCIASDIHIQDAKQNIDRRSQQPESTSDKKITLYKHDIFDPFKKPFLKNANIIVTEGWLGPIITEKTGERDIYRAQDEIIKLYKMFLTHVQEFFSNITLVFTIPIHQGVASYVQESLEDRCKDNKVDYEFVKELYKRPKQKIARQIVIVKL